jgi:hypothetical protein
MNQLLAGHFAALKADGLLDHLSPKITIIRLCSGGISELLGS